MPGKRLCVHCINKAKQIQKDFEEKEKVTAEAEREAAVAQRQVHAGYHFRRSTAETSVQSAAPESPESNQPRQTTETSPVYIPSPLARAELRVMQRDRAKEENDVFEKFAAVSGIHDLRIGRTEFTEMNQQSQTMHIEQARTIIDEVMRRLCPNGPDQLWTAIIDEEIQRRESKQPSQQLIQVTVQAYLEAETAAQKRQLLSLLAASLSLKECQEHIPQLSESQYYRAKRFSEEFGAGLLIKPDRQSYVRYDPTAVEHFINYALSFNVVTDLPFGEAVIKLSDGEQLTVPNVIRDSAPERIIQKYRKYCEEQIRAGILPESFSHLKRTTLLEILDACKASKRKALQGLDYFTAAGGNAFDTFIAIVNELAEKGQIGNDLKRTLIRELQTAKNYLKSEFKAHIAMHGSVGDHCIKFALSDQSSPAFTSVCDGPHDDHCQQCDAVTASMDQVSAAINQSNLSAMEKADLQFQFDGAERDVQLWKAHKLRLINQDLARQNVIQNMVPNQSVLIVMDWAMKLLPMWYREDMSKFFGKRGLPWHVSVATVKTENGFQTRTFLHCFDQCKQDSEAVLAILDDVLRRMKAEKPDLVEVYLKADNAGCYHSAQSLLSLPPIAKEYGLQIKRFDFSDPQGGKADCDRMAATVKRHVNMFVAEKHNCTTGKEFVDAVESHGGIPGVSIHHGKLEATDEAPRTKKPVIKGISNLFNFEFDGDCIRCWKAFNIGEGYILPNKATENHGHFRFVEQYGTQRPVQFRNLGNSSQSNEVPESSEASDKEDEEVELDATEDSTGEEKFFHCTEDGCTKEYRHEAHLERHYVSGKHKYDVPKVRLMDFAIKSYKKQLEDPERTNIFGECSSAVLSAPEAQQPSLESGWALKQQKRAVQFSEKQREFLREKFREGEETTVKYTPEQVAKQMRTATTADGEPLFTKEEFLNRNQIFSYFSRLAASKRLAGDSDLTLMDLVEIEREEREVDDQETISAIHNAVYRMAHASNAEGQSTDEGRQTESATKSKGSKKLKKTRQKKSTEKSHKANFLSWFSPQAYLLKRREQNAAIKSYKENIREESRQKLKAIAQTDELPSVIINDESDASSEQNETFCDDFSFEVANMVIPGSGIGTGPIPFPVDDAKRHFRGQSRHDPEKRFDGTYETAAETGCLKRGYHPDHASTDQSLPAQNIYSVGTVNNWDHRHQLQLATSKDESPSQIMTDRAVSTRTSHPTAINQSHPTAAALPSFDSIRFPEPPSYNPFLDAMPDVPKETPSARLTRTRHALLEEP